MFKCLSASAALLCATLAPAPGHAAGLDLSLAAAEMPVIFGAHAAQNGHVITKNRENFQDLNGNVTTQIVPHLWLPWAQIRVTIDGKPNVVMFYHGYEHFTFNCTDDGNIDGVCLSGADQAMVIAADFLDEGGTLKLAGPAQHLSDMPMWFMVKSPDDFAVQNLSNGYVGIFFHDALGGQGYFHFFDDIYLIRNGVVSDAGGIPRGASFDHSVGDNEVKTDTFNSTLTFGQAARGMPDSIIVTWSGTAPVDPNGHPADLSRLAVYAFDGARYSGPDEPGM